MSSSSQKQHKDCLICSHIKCINFYYKDEKENYYGELTALTEFHNEKMHPPCHVGSLIYPEEANENT